MQASISIFGPYAFISVFDLLDLPSVEISGEIKENLLLIRDALQLSSHILAKDATQCSGQMVGRLQSISQPLIHSFLDQARAWWEEKPWLNPVQVKFTSPGGPLLQTITGDIGGIQLSVLPKGNKVITVSDSIDFGQTVRIWDIDNRSLHEKHEHVFRNSDFT